MIGGMRSHNRFAGLSKGLNRKRGERNKTETEYEETYLIGNPEIATYMFEPFSVRLSHPVTGMPATYTPDFLIVMSDGLTYVDDVKGTGPDDPAAIVRLKCAAELFPFWIWRHAKKQAKKNGGGFKITEV